MAVAPINPTQITPPRVAFIDERSGAISREWYRFFLSLRNSAEVTQQETSLLVDANSLAASYDAMLADLAQSVDSAPDSNTFTASLASQFYTFQNDVLVAPPSLFGTVTSVGASGGTTGLTFTGSPITTSGTFTLGGTLGIANGGTNGTATATAGAVSYGTGTAYAFSAAGASGQVLTSAGAGAPTWTTPTTGTVTSVTGTAPVVSSGGSTPAISMAAATTSVNGYLTSTDWTTFNNKGSGTVTSVGGTGTVNGITLTGTVTTTGSLTLGGTLSGVSLTTQVSGVLPAVNGGTGQSVYAVGDLLYASTTTALSKLADIATGNAIISGGVGVAPLYGKIGLTTHVSGTLPVANGGTNASTFTAGSVVFAGTSGTYTQNNANFFWDNTNARLGVGTTTTANKLTVSVSSAGAAAGIISLVNPNNTTGTAADLDFVNHSSGTLATGRIRGLINGASDYPMSFWTYNGSGLAERMRLTAAGDVGLGTTTPTTGSVSNQAILNAGMFTTLKGSVSATSGVAVTLATIPNYAMAVYMVSCGVSSGAPVSFTAVAIVSADNSVLRVTSLQTAALMTITVAGTNIQATQASGGAANIIHSITRIG
jgi:hypothetical protein